MDAQFWEFVGQHCAQDATRLRLKFHNDPRGWVHSAIAHIEALPKARRKFGPDAGTHRGWPHVLPSLLAVEQATPPVVARYNAAHIPSGSRVVDMTAGLGSDDVHIAPRAGRLVCFDLKEENTRALEVNLGAFDNVDVRCGDSVEWLHGYDGPRLDVVFIDPARRDSAGGRVYNLHDCQPDLIWLYPLIESKARIMVAKLSPMLDITQTFRDLPACHTIHVNEDGGEVRQLLAVADFDSSTNERRVVVVGNGWSYSFLLSEAACAEAPHMVPKAGDWLVEPSPAMMKAGAFNLVAKMFGWGVVSENSHLFVSADKPEVTHPGRKGYVAGVYPVSSSILKKLGKEIGPAEIVVRNMPGFTPQVLRKRLGIAEGSHRRVVATTLDDGRRVIIVVDRDIEV